MRGRTKANTVEEPIYKKPPDNKYWLYRTKLFLLCPVPYVWFLDWREIEKIKKLWK